MILKYLPPFLLALSGGWIGALAADRVGLIRGTQTIPIAVLDRGALLRAIDRGAPGVEETRRQYEQTLALLKAEGYLVIDQGWVIHAPEALHADRME